MVLLRHTKRVHQATCSLSIVLDHITLTSCPNNPRAPRLWPRGSLSCAVAMDMMVVASLSFSRGPPAGIQSFNNYAGILLFAPACVCLWECASETGVDVWELTLVACLRISKHICFEGSRDWCHHNKSTSVSLSTYWFDIFDTMVPTLKMSMQCAFIPRDDSVFFYIYINFIL